MASVDRRLEKIEDAANEKGRDFRQWRMVDKYPDGRMVDSATGEPVDELDKENFRNIVIHIPEGVISQ